MNNARNTDPVSSKISGHEVEASGRGAAQRQIVLEAVKAHSGWTSKELAAFSGLDRYMIARRLPEIPQVRKGDIVTCSISGRPSVTWWLREI